MTLEAHFSIGENEKIPQCGDGFSSDVGISTIRTDHQGADTTQTAFGGGNLDGHDFRLQGKPCGERCKGCGLMERGFDGGEKD